MDTFFSLTGIRLSDFIHLTMLFYITMLAFFGVKNKKKLNYFLLVIFILQCLLYILLRDGLNVKVFAALMLFSVVTLEMMVNRKRKLQA